MHVDARGVASWPLWMWARCPYCMERLGMKENFKRRLRKKCRCGKCGRNINERHIIW